MSLLTGMNRPQQIFYFSMMYVVFACSELHQTNAITVASLVFYNNTSTPIYNAKLRVSKTHGLVACGLILPEKKCSTTFPIREYQGNPVIVSWEQAGQTWSSAEFYVHRHGGPLTNEPTIAMAWPGDHGAISARLILQSSSRSPASELHPQLR